MSNIRLLLEAGANPDPEEARSLICAINAPEHSLEMVKLLVEHGADPNPLYFWQGDKELPFTPYSHALAAGKMDVAEYLRSKGGDMPPPPKPKPPKCYADEVRTWFTVNFGPTMPVFVSEIVPGPVPVELWCVPPGGDRRKLVLFTLGMSRQELAVPPEAAEFRFMELFLELPESWPISPSAIERPETAWPFQFLHQLASLAAATSPPLPPGAVIVDDPPAPLWPGSRFDSLMLLMERDVPVVTTPTAPKRRKKSDPPAASQPATVHLFRVVPLLPEERELERKQGLGALLRAFDRVSIPFVFDPNRPTAVG
jgi:hypothetical protein